MVLSRRDLMQGAAAGGLLLGFPGLAAPFEASAAPAARPLLDRVGEVCARLAPKGWGSLLLAVSRGTLDIGAPDLAEALARPIADLDRTVPGFADFAPGPAARGIEPGSPARSLLYHALASAEVLTDGEGRSLGAFPTLAEIEAVEDYVYGVRPPTLDRLREIAGDNALGVVVFAVDYRAATGSVHGRHADLCFSRTGIARMGTVDPFYDARARQFTPADPKRPFVFRTVPQRFAPYIAMQVTGADGRLFGPRDTVSGDDERSFWVPLHKLFDGPECIEGLDLSVTLGSHLVNEKLKHMHLFLREQGYPTDWTGKALEQYPFVIRGERIASLLPPPRHGSGVLGPRPAPFANRARFRDQWLSFNVSSDLVGDPGILYFSSVQLIPGSLETEPTYLEGTAPDNDRRAPEYVNIRHRLNPDGSLDDLNLDPDMDRIIREGGYRAQHYIDFAGDGSVAVRCPQLEAEIDTFKPAFCSVAPPDFFPLVNQRGLVAWWPGGGRRHRRRSAPRCGRFRPGRCRSSGSPATSDCRPVSTSTTTRSPRSSASRRPASRYPGSSTPTPGGATRGCRTRPPASPTPAGRSARGWSTTSRGCPRSGTCSRTASAHRSWRTSSCVRRWAVTGRRPRPTARVPSRRSRTPPGSRTRGRRSCR
ncbi:twin-arginine translocation signal domain-containing protein [Streptomyces sp. ISL-44]|uniref:twin-arginine translocation signal domain-containing protein n=1 Tax=Streptomyces sp. ISL-44 TaxID=2819184 RepID=UPI001BEB4670|nr:twin-arginine translocation signal domain-containing protein [Streptomyces sp. ISL-44]MBT2541080.1 twin-arginine translocation signal domain-containing protein [Streptomyces sp. ISL-44]